MSQISTCGGPAKRTQFEYVGSVADGFDILFRSGTAKVTATFLAKLLAVFRGKVVPGGFSMTNPTPGSVGEWTADNSKRLNHQPLTPRHASFICGVLVHEGFAKSTLKGNSVFMQFEE